MGQKRFIISAGGTGGHLGPAKRLAYALREESCEVLVVGSGLAENPFFHPTTLPYREIRSATFSLRKPRTLVKAAPRILSGLLESRRILREFRPDTVIGFGSYTTLPLLAAAQFFGSVPLILHEQNAFPGKVNRLFSKRASYTAVFFEEASTHLRGKCRPVRFPFQLPTTEECARLELGLEVDRLTFLVFGGSQGAHFLNQKMNELLAQMIELLPPFQVIHLVGKGGQAPNYEAMGIHAIVQEYATNMPHLWSAADCAITRSGAATILEAIHSKTPALLIPYPFASDGHQLHNAKAFCSRVGGGIYIEEKEATSWQVLESLTHLVSDLPQKKASLERVSKQGTHHEFERLLLET